MISNKKTKSLNQIKQKKSIFCHFNIIKQCRKYELSPWQCPQFLFLIMGLIIIVSVILVYMIGANYIEDPLMIALLVIFIAILTSNFLYILYKIFQKS